MSASKARLQARVDELERELADYRAKDLRDAHRLEQVEASRARLEEAEIDAQRIARTIEEMTPKGWLFTLVLASAGKDGFMTYVANIERDASCRMLLELCGKWIKNEEVI